MAENKRIRECKRFAFAENKRMALVLLHSLILLFSYPLFHTRADEIDVGNHIPMQSANMRIMSKQSGKAQSYLIPVGKSVKYDKLEILVRKCLAADEFSPEDFFMFAEIAKGGRRIFSGWMIQSEPGSNPLQDPDTDLWLVKCE